MDTYIKPTVPDNLIFLQAVPIDQYFLWQIQVQVVNFRKFGISDKMHVIVWYPRHRAGEIKDWVDMGKKYPEMRLFFYEDSGVNLGLYISQLRPHSLKKHFKLHKDELEGKVLFYHDSDIIFNYLPDFMSLVNDDIWWQSNTTGYLDYSYLLRKEKEGNIPDNLAIKKLAEIGGVTLDIIKQYDGKTGGAQTILKNIDSNFWEDIENQCIEIRKAFLHSIKGSINSTYFPSENAGFQSWVADMWAINFAIWKRDYTTDITDKLDFSWATDSMDTYNKKPIYHNAGATSSSKDIFYKGAWIQESPLYRNLPLPPEDKASRVYVQAINEVK